MLNTHRAMAVAAVWGLLSGYALCEGQPQVPGDTLEAARKLRARNSRERREAARLLIEEREAAIRRMLEVLESHKDETSGEEDGPVHLTVRVLMNWRALEATGHLIRMVDFKVNYQSGAKRPLGAEFICAFALTKIGGRSVLQAVTRQIAEEPSLSRRRLLTWVVFRLIGKECGKVFLDGATKGTSRSKSSRLVAAGKEVRLGDGLLGLASK